MTALGQVNKPPTRYTLVKFGGQYENQGQHLPTLLGSLEDQSIPDHTH